MSAPPVWVAAAGAATGAEEGAGAGAGAAAAGACAAAGAGAALADVCASTVQITVSLATLSPTCKRTSTTLPITDDGTSMLALSDSSTISDCSCSISSPGRISTSITSTASKSDRKSVV